MFLCLKKRLRGDVSFTHTKHMFDRKKIDNNHLGGGGGGGLYGLMSISL